MPDWPIVKLVEVAAKKRWSLNGGPFGSKLVSKDYVQSGVPVIRGGNLPAEARFSLDDLVFVSKEKADDLLANNAHPGDIIFTQRGTLGQVGIIPTNGTHERYVISQSQMKLTVDEAKVIREFIYYFFRCPTTVQQIKNHSMVAGVPHINLDTLRNWEIPLPPVGGQEKIVGILSAYDDLIENNTRRIQILERMAQAVYREWFTHFRFPGHAKTTLVASPVGKIPQGWEPRRLGDLAQESRRTIDPDEVEPSTPYIGLEHMPRKSIALGDWGSAKEVQSTKLLFKKGDILFGKIRPYFHKVGVAAVDGVCSTDAIVITPKQSAHFALVLACVSSEPFVSHATQTSQGTKMPRANWNVLTKYPLPLPPAPLLNLFTPFVNDTVALIQNLVFKNRNLRRTRDLLLPKLISGALDVSKLDIETA